MISKETLEKALNNIVLKQHPQVERISVERFPYIQKYIHPEDWKKFTDVDFVKDNIKIHFVPGFHAFPIHDSIVKEIKKTIVNVCKMSGIKNLTFEHIHRSKNSNNE